MILPIQNNAPYQYTDEDQLIDDLRHKNPQAFDYMLRREQDRMRHVALRILKSDQDADDAIQNATMSALKAIDRFEGNSQISTWVHRIVVNESLMILRKRKRRREVSAIQQQSDNNDAYNLQDNHEYDTNTAEVTLQQRETMDIVRRGIDKLPPLYREVVELREMNQLNTEESAEKLGVSVSVVKTRLHRARAALKNILEPELANITLN